MKSFVLSLLLIPCLAVVFAAAETPPPAAVEVPIAEVLALGPLPVATAAIAADAKLEELERALAMQLARNGAPAAGTEVAAFGQRLRWQRVAPGTLDRGDALWLWSVALDAERFVSGRLRIEGLRKPVLWRDGQVQAIKDGAAELDLATGSHALWLLHRGRDGEAVPALRWAGKAAHDRVAPRLTPSRLVSAQQLTNAQTVTRLAVSPDGRRVALSFNAREEVAKVDLRRFEIRDLHDGRIVQQWTGTVPSAAAWSPDGRWLALQQDKQLWLRDADGNAARLLLAEHERIDGWRWHPDSGSILFEWTRPFDAKDAKLKRLRGLEDRWAGFRDNSQLYQVDVASGLVRPLTSGESSVDLLDVDPAGRRLLLSERVIDYAEPPHSLFKLFELSLPDLTRREVLSLRAIDAALFAGADPEAGYWLLTGPDLPIGDGSVLPTGTPANGFDGQLYRLARDGRSARSVSRDFTPAITAISRLGDGDLVLAVVEGDRTPLYRHHVRSGRFERIETGLDVLDGHAVSTGRAAVVVAAGTEAAAPQRLVAVDLARNRPRVLVDSAQTDYAQTRFGEVRDWSFDNRDGDRIDGRYYLPPDFDPARRYPLIVYYYGGTLPVNRQFTGRYPFHLWAANGYVIYVVQPRGTVGYGQRYSALHVNAWGDYAADDIIEGTRAFLAAHPFVDPKRVGNIGASYGGFMTMLLATRTDLFATSIAHAGISDLTGYWGEGWWGYGYSGVASRGSFPWNNRDLYVEHSPIYHADRITTPLLLLTGDADTNVPPGESRTMYTALKLLGKEVEMVEVAGQDHHILDREKRHLWWDTILAWFDRGLKDQPQWWQDLYPETAPKSDPKTEPKTREAPAR